MLLFFHKPYIAIIGDIKNSKKLQDRLAVQVNLKNVLKKVNDAYSSDIASKFTITLGDEFQGLLHNGSHVMEIISSIEREMYPVKIRFGIGIGTITTEIDPQMAIGADGPSYYRAREAIEYLRKSEKRKQTDTADIHIETDRDHTSVVVLLNTIFTLMTVIKESWSGRQREVIWDMLVHQDSQVNAAKRLHIQQPTVQKLLAKGNYYAYKDAFDTVGEVLGEIKKDGL